jgi:hypothetical protein
MSRSLGAVGALGAALLAGLLAAGPSFAQGETVSIGSLSLEVNGRGSVELRALDIGPPGLGAWVADIQYSPAVVREVACFVPPSGVCNEALRPDTVRVAGADATGLRGDLVLATITFACTTPGRSNLALTVHTLADRVALPIQAATSDGSVTCLAAPGRTPNAPTGDANCNGRVDSIDAALILQLEAGLVRSLPCQAAADVNGDRRVNSLDAALILQYGAGLIDGLPASAPAARDLLEHIGPWGSPRSGKPR